METTEKTFLPVLVVTREMVRAERMGVRISSLSVFSDMEWSFADENPGINRAKLVVNFKQLLPKFGYISVNQCDDLIDSLKCLVYSLIFDPPRAQLGIATIAKSVSLGHGLGNLYIYMSRNGIGRAADLTEFDLSQFLKQLAESPLKGKGDAPINNRALLSRATGIEWLYLQRSKLADFVSFDPWKAEGSCGKWSRENAQKLIPRDQLSTQPWSDNLTRAIFYAALAELERKNFLIDRLQYRADENRKKETIGQKAYYKKKREKEDVRDLYLKKDFVLFRSSVFILVGYLTGMRSGELRSIQGGVEEICTVKEVVFANSRIKAYFINGKLSKWQPVPKIEEWQTMPLAHEAIKALSEVNSYINNQASNYLFRGSNRQKTETNGRQMEANAALKGINLLANHHNIDLAEVQGRISVIDLRRTYARIVTRDGMGAVELQTQLKHHDINLTQQYGAPSTREYLSLEKNNWSKEQYAELLTGSDHLVGGGASEISAMKLEFIGLAREEKDDFLNSLTKKALIDQVGDGLCLYRPERALCGGEKVNCRPADCKNSVIKLDAALETLMFRKAENQRLLKRFSRQPAKREHLKVQLAEIEKLLAQDSGADTGRQQR